jgi:hypothetical protein
MKNYQFEVSILTHDANRSFYGVDIRSMSSFVGSRVVLGTAVGGKASGGSGPSADRLVDDATVAPTGGITFVPLDSCERQHSALDG